MKFAFTKSCLQTHSLTDWLSSDRQIKIPRWPLFAPRLPCSRWFSMNIEWSKFSESIKAPGRSLNVLMSSGIWVLLHLHLLGHPPYWKPRQPGSIESLIFFYMYDHLISKIWFGTTDYEMSYKATRSEVDAEVTNISIIALGHHDLYAIPYIWPYEQLIW